MPQLGSHFATFTPRIRRLPKTRPITEADLIRPTFSLEREGRVEIYYAPMDWLRPKALVAIVGITPSKGTMRVAYQTAVEGLAAGHSAARILDNVKSSAPFSGFRQQLESWLDWLGLPGYLGVERSADIWQGRASQMVHATSVLRYPTLVRGENYSGYHPPLTKHPIFRRYLLEVLGPELAQIPEALIIPLGARVDEALDTLAEAHLIDRRRLLTGFPHPSGQNGSRMQTWNHNRGRLRRRVDAWFAR